MKAYMLAGHGGYTVRQGLESFFGKENVEALFARDLLARLASGRELPALVAFPGGSSSEMAEEIGEWGKEVMHGYVAAGGKFFGTCAGGTLGASSAVYAPPGYPTLVRSKNFCLELLPVSARGPLPAPEGYQGPYSQGVEALCDCPLAAERPLHVYYGGGCVFEVPEGSNVRTLAHFERFARSRTYPSAAIVQGSLGKGEVLLSAAHPDTKWDHMRFMQAKLARGEFKLKSQFRPNPAEDFLAQSMQSVVHPQNQDSFRPPSEWFHDVLLSHFMGIDPQSSYEDFRPPSISGPGI